MRWGSCSGPFRWGFFCYNYAVQNQTVVQEYSKRAPPIVCHSLKEILLNPFSFISSNFWSYHDS